MTKDPFRPVDDDARTLARDLLGHASHAALAVELDGRPYASRIALAVTGKGLLTLVSDLAPHTGALRRKPGAALLIGEPGKGDPLAHPRMSISVDAAFVDKDSAAQDYLAKHPKAQLYFGFADFHMVRFTVLGAHLNGGFGKAYKLSPEDLAL